MKLNIFIFLTILNLSIFAQQTVVIKTISGEEYRGKFSDLDFIGLKTDLGDIKIAPDKLLEIKIWKHREEDIQQMEKHVEELIEKLGDDDVQVRDDAEAKLKELGVLCLPTLNEYKDHEDLEVRIRIQNILESLKGQKYEIIKDQIIGTDFRLKGWVLHGEFSLVTKYGLVNVPIKDIATMSFAVTRTTLLPDRTSYRIILKDGEFLSGKWVDESITFELSYGTIKIPAGEIQKITINEKDAVQTENGFFKGVFDEQSLKFKTDFGEIKFKKKDISLITTAYGRIEDGNIAHKDRGAKVTGAIQGNENINDGNTNDDPNRFAYVQLNQPLIIELAETYLLTKINFINSQRMRTNFRYYIELSTDSKEWTRIVDKTNADYTGNQVDEFSATPAKYIRIVITAVPNINYLSINEIEAYCR